MKIGIRNPFYKKKSSYGYFTFSTTDDIKLIKNLFDQGDFSINTATPQGQMKAYSECSIVQSIIDKRSQYFSSRVNKIIDKNGKEIDNAQSQDVLKLLNQPNPLQNGIEFDYQVNAYRDIFGFCPIFKVYGSNRDSGLPVMMWTISPVNFTYEVTNKLFYQNEISKIIKFVEFSAYEATETIHLEGADIEKVWIINGKTSKKCDNYTNESPLFALKHLINDFQIAVNIYGVLLKQSVLGIISNRTKDAATGWMPLSEKTETEVKSKLQTKYGLIEGRDNFIVTDRDLFFQSLLTNVGNLQIPECLRITVLQICNKLGFAVELLSDKDVTYENKKQSEIIQYQNEVIPFADNYADSLTEFLELKDMRIKKDYNHLPILQESQKDKADLFVSVSNACKTSIEAGVITQAEAKNIYQNLNII